MPWDTDIARQNVIDSEGAGEITNLAMNELLAELDQLGYADSTITPEQKVDDFWQLQDELKSREEIEIIPIFDIELEEIFVRLVREGSLRVRLLKSLFPDDIIDYIFLNYDNVSRPLDVMDKAKQLLINLRASSKYLIPEDRRKIKGSFAARRRGEAAPDIFDSSEPRCWPRLLALREAGPRNPYWAVKFRASEGAFREATALDGDPYYWRQGGRTWVRHDPSASCGRCSASVCDAARFHPTGVREVVVSGIRAEAIESTFASSIYDVLRKCTHP